ncbi:sigma factor-like helix-turn-helix DNA-binding protein [Arcanobacterium canis]|uniref:Sigma factor-like helix-turn-helix DNA-binding protein n=2 Tax=Arcanobacterium canis TaxID=999183 RepID=A0ABY8FZE3_9ACTO|nr:sigma factor-like helix-turn-helix DNA-binding protein [Arcanobacterium canis]WFM83905.1 sigma factor-like helix-turn-helix DNA-binding protein [Arcanobacterium canis]
MGFIIYTSVAGDPIVVEAEDRWVEIVADLDRQEANSDHNYRRQDRRGVKFCSWDAYNAYGNQEAGATPSAQDIVCENEIATEHEQAIRAVGELLVDLIEKLPPVQREVFIAVHIQQRPAVEVAASRGVSKAVISKTLKKATERLREGLIAGGGVTPAIFVAFL